MPNLVAIGQTLNEIFGFLKMAASAILDFKHFTFLTVRKVELRHRAKCRLNRSNLGRDLAIFFDFSRRRPPPSWIF